MIAPLLCVLLGSLYSPAAAGTCADRSEPRTRTPAYWFASGVALRPGDAPSSNRPASGRFLIAKRSITDPNFAETVILLLTYTERGAMGVIINHPTEMRLAAALPTVKELRDRPERIFMGGPVAVNTMLLLFRAGERLPDSKVVFANVYVSGSLKALRKVLGKAGQTDRLRAYAGYAGWGPRQLDGEIARGDWIVAPADAASVFDMAPPNVWPKLIDRFSAEWARGDSDQRALASRY